MQGSRGQNECIEPKIATQDYFSPGDNIDAEPECRRDEPYVTCRLSGGGIFSSEGTVMPVSSNQSESKRGKA